MARPNLIGITSGVPANESGNLSPTIPTHTTNDILVARVTFYGPNTPGAALDIPTPASWTLFGSQGGGDDLRHATFWRRAPSAGTTVTFTRGVSWDTGPDTIYGARVAVIRDCKTSGNPYDTFTTQGTETGANAVWLAVTGYADRFHTMFMGSAEDISAPSEDGYTVDHAADTHGANVGLSITLLYKNIDGGTEGGGNLTSNAPATGNYRVDQVVWRPETISGARTDLAMLIDRIIAASYTRRGVVAMPLSLNIFSHAWQQHYGAVALPMTLGIVTTGQSVIFGRTDGLAVAIERVTSGNYTRRGVSSLEITLDRQVIGRGSFHAVAQGLDMTVGIVTVGALPLALGVISEGTLTLLQLDPATLDFVLPVGEDAVTGTPVSIDAQTLQALTEGTLFLDPFNEIEGA